MARAASMRSIWTAFSHADRLAALPHARGGERRAARRHALRLGLAASRASRSTRASSCRAPPATPSTLRELRLELGAETPLGLLWAPTVQQARFLASSQDVRQLASIAVFARPGFK